ncbi:MAG: hypothetical protein R6U32_05460, partial [Candidatus Woesearchaeota archaeon]
ATHNQYSHNFTGLDDGDYSVEAYAQDWAGNVNSTGVRTVTVAQPPSGEILTPTNESYNTSQEQNFTINASDNTELSNATLTVANKTDTYNQTTYYFSAASQKIAGLMISLKDGFYNWFWDVMDSAGNLFTTGNSTITIDTTKPTLAWEDPTPANNSGKSESFTLNITITDANLANITYSWNGTNTSYNASELTNLSSTEWLFTHTQTGLIIGETYNYSVSATDLTGNKNNTETRHLLGNSWPVLQSLNYTPNTTYHLDPQTEVSITVNISDSDNNMDSAILQWRNGTEAWSNTSMSNTTPKNITTIFEGSFTPSGEGNHSFRIYFNDTEGADNTSAINNLSVFWDCTWNISPQNIGQFAGWDENKNITNITINNTGDENYSDSNCELDFRLEYDLAEGRIYFDDSYYKPSSTYTLQANTDTSIRVNASFLAETLEEDFEITVTEMTGITSTSTRNATGTLISTSGGPYLYQELESAPPSLYLKKQNFSLKSYIRNVVGDGTIAKTAYNVSHNWSLPPGFLARTGNAAKSYDNLTNSSLFYHNLSMVFNSSNLEGMSPGTVTVHLYAQGYDSDGSLIEHSGGKTVLSEKVNITLSCYGGSDGIYVTACGELDGDHTEEEETTTDSDSGSSGSGGAGGRVSGGAAGAYISRFIRTSEDVEVVRGEGEKFSVSFENPYTDSQLKDLNIEIGGIYSDYLEAEPGRISKLSANEPVNVSVTVSAPSYFSEGKYNLTITMRGTRVENMTTSEFASKKHLSMTILEISRERATEYLNKTKDFMREMSLEGMYTRDINKTFQKMNTSYSKDKTAPVKEGFKEAKDLYQTAFKVKDTLNSMKNNMQTAELKGIETTQTEKLINLAKSAYLRGDYHTALDRLKEAQLSYAVEVKGEFRPLYYIKQYPKETAAMAGIAAVLFFNTVLFARWRALKRRVKLLDQEEKLIIGLMKVVQKHCFDDGKMSMEEYQNTMNQYETRLHEIIHKRIETESKISNILRLGTGKRKALERESKRLKEILEDTQKQYFDKGKMETRVYQNMLKSYSTRLSEVEEKLAVLEANKELKKSRWKIFKR